MDIKKKLKMRIEKIKVGDLQLSLCLQEHFNKAMQEGKSNKSYKYWSTLYKELKKGYEPEEHKFGYIKLSGNGYMLDGNHRAVILQNLYGNEYEIDVYVAPKIIHWIAIGIVMICTLLITLFKIILYIIPKRIRPNIRGIGGDCMVRKTHFTYQGEQFSTAEAIMQIIKTILFTPISIITFFISGIGKFLGIRK